MAEQTKQEAAAEVKRLRKQAEDEKIPQAARNQMLDKANEIEAKWFSKETGKPYAKGGAVKKKAAAKKAPAAKTASRQSPVVAIMVGAMDKKPVKKMANGGMANCGASVKSTQRSK